MPRKPTKGPRSPRDDIFTLPSPDTAVGQHYYYVTLRPWPSLLFLLPMMLIFEVGIYVIQGGVPGGNSQLVAVYLIERMVMALGAARYLYIFPAMAMIAILLAWHVAGRHPWRFDPFVLPGMLGESLMWTVPLFAFNRLVNQAVLAGAADVAPTWIAQIIRSVGAGLYEELVFRLMLITGLDILLVNILHLPRSASRVFSVLASAALFSAQHHPPLGADDFNLGHFLFRTGAGVYLAGLFLYRGFGIAAGTHVFYNVIVVTLSALRT